MELSVSYGGGTRHGPAALLAASQQLEAWDGSGANPGAPGQGGPASPGDLGLHTQPPVDCRAAPGLAPEQQAEAILQRVTRATHDALACRALPVLLGGEHTLTLGALRAVQAHANAPFGLVQFDAHADLRPVYEGSPYSHACVMHRAVADLSLPLAQFGVRDFCREEAAIREQYGVLHHDAPTLWRDGLPQAPLPERFPRQVYLSFDVDGLDAALMPATGTPSPGGLGWYEALTLVERCLAGRTLIGMDVVELAPIAGLHAADYTAARLTWHILCLAQRLGALPRPL